MASLRRPSQLFTGKSGKPEPSMGSRPRNPSGGQNRDARKSTVETRMKSRRMSMRYAGPESFGVGQAGGANFLMSDPYQFQLDVAPPIQEEDEYDYDASQAPVRMSPSVRPGSLYDASPRSFAERQLEAEDAQGGSAQDEQIRRRGQAEPVHEWDFSDLGKSDVDVAAFIRKALAGADKEEKKRFIAALQKQKDVSASDLQKNVFKHYAEFVNISKEISTLENDMLELKELLNEWKTVPQLMGMDDTLAPTLDKEGNVDRHRYHRRNSPMDLQQMYKVQLSNLWSSVEGSQKYIPFVTGRHLVYETHGFVELNAATYKAKQNVSLFLLSDVLLVAGRRRFKAGPSASTSPDYERGRMVAERCWVLTDLVVIDLKDSGDLTNALKIKRGKEVCVCRAARPEDKKALLSAFRQVSQELAEKRRKESEAEQERRKTLWHGEASTNRMTRMSLFMDGGGNARPLTTIGTSVTDDSDLLWIDEYGDDLTMAIATQDWDQGVKLVERGQDLLRTVANNATATELLKFKLDTLRPNLITQIAKDLGSPDIRKAAAAQLIALLQRLSRAELARDTFLKARHDLMLRLVRTIKHEGDISMYVHELSVVCFTIVRHTSDWYMNAFKDNAMASGFVTWAKEQIDYFGDVFRRQVYAPTIDQAVIDECHKVTLSANRKLLRDAGLDFTYLLNAVTARDVSSPSTSTFQESKSSNRGFRRDTHMPGPTVSLAPPALAKSTSRSPHSTASSLESESHLSTPLSKSASRSPGAAQASLPTPDLSRGNTAPLSINRRRGDSSANRAGLRDISGASMVSVSSANSAMSASTTGTASPAPRPPPRSDRRSRAPQL